MTPTKLKKFTPHASVPWPLRLEMERADNLSVVNADPMFMADRQAIVNNVVAYSYLIDKGRRDNWFALFSDDLVFENSTPQLGTVIIKSTNAFKDLVKTRTSYLERLRKVCAATHQVMSTWPFRPLRRLRYASTC
jgi:hypothetical protein